LFQTYAVPPGADVTRYMTSVQSLSALTDDHAVTSFPLSAATPAQIQYVRPTTACSYDQSTYRGQYTESGQNGYCLPAQQQYGGRAQPRWNVSGYRGAIADGYDWCVPPNAGHHAQQQYVSGFGRHTESSAWHRGWSARYHPYRYATAAATTAGCGMISVSAAPSSSSSNYVCNGVDQRAPAHTAQSYSHSLDGAVHHFCHPSIMPQDAVQPDYVAYLTNQADCVNAYNNYQISAPHDYFNNC